MRQRIWKYPLKITDLQDIEIPGLVRFLSVKNQLGVLCLWALVDLDAEFKTTTIEIIGTGNPIPSGTRHFIETVIISDFVWHVFERL